MAAVTIEKDRLLFEAGKPVLELYLILKGSFSLTFPGGEITLSKGDVPGICSLAGDVHLTTCRALEDSSVLVYPVSDIASLDAFFRESSDYCVVFTRSAFRQMNALIQRCELVRFTCNDLYTGCTRDYSFYLACCMKLQLKSEKLQAMSELAPFMDDSVLENWAISYYDSFEHLLSGSGSSLLAKEPSVPAGLIAGVCQDFQKALTALDTFAAYEGQVLSLYLSEDGSDLFGLYTSLLVQANASPSDARPLEAAIRRMVSRIENSACADRVLLEKRTAAFQSALQAAGTAVSDPEADQPAVSDCLEQLSSSLETILSYSGAEDNFCRQFTDLIEKYRDSSDRNATDDGSRSLRQEITASFYELYRLIFFKAVKETSLPLPVRMFLYFGYVDEQLAGTENAVFLGQTAEHLTTDGEPHIFTLYDWLVAIYDGHKKPSRNEFDEDYADHLHSLKVAGKISASEERALAADAVKKVEYELKNMVPTANKITCGRISTFCPVFSSHNILKPLDISLVTPEALKEAWKAVLSMDYSAFYREYVYTNESAGIPREFFHTEVLPDVILMPGIGTRGVMWQEIEGHRRTTSARMLLSVFYLEDLRVAIVRLAGEFRWEMCKRVQGPRWNDVSDRSLTSEYFDYIQFYKKNHELSADAKEKLKNSLLKARGSFKEMFVRDYITYILFEGTGSPRLTKPARTILFTYCPFASPVRKTLSGNPIYKEMMDHHEIHLKQQLHRLDLLEKKLENAGLRIPKELYDERNFWES